MGVPIHPLQVDHENRDKLDNRRSNLRYLDSSGNIRNSDRIDGAQYIYYRRSRDRYEVRIPYHGAEYYVGSFATQREAEKARDEFTNSNVQDGYRG